jgi:hypothetical protein
MKSAPSWDFSDFLSDVNELCALWDFTRCRTVVVTDVSVQPISPIFADTVIQELLDCFIVEEGSDSL